MDEKDRATTWFTRLNNVDLYVSAAGDSVTLHDVSPLCRCRLTVRISGRSVSFQSNHCESRFAASAHPSVRRELRKELVTEHYITIVLCPIENTLIDPGVVPKVQNLSCSEFPQ